MTKFMKWPSDIGRNRNQSVFREPFNCHLTVSELPSILFYREIWCDTTIASQKMTKFTKWPSDIGRNRNQSVFRDPFNCHLTVSELLETVDAARLRVESVVALTISPNSLVPSRASIFLQIPPICWLFCRASETGQEELKHVIPLFRCQDPFLTLGSSGLCESVQITT